MLSQGGWAPDFELPGVGEDGITTYRLSDYLDTGAAVLLFYPFTFSPVCTTQLCRFRDADWLTVGEGIDVFGVSVDSVYAQQRFREEYDLQFPLVTDRLAHVADEYGVRYDEWEGHPSVTKRAVFGIDETQTIRYSWVTEDANDSPSLDELAESIAWV